MSTISNFLGRTNPAMSFQIPWPYSPWDESVKPRIELTVKRVPQAVQNNIIFDARAAMKREGIEPPNHVPQYVTVVVKDEHGNDVEERQMTPEWLAYYGEFNLKMAYAFYDQAKNHFAGWKSLEDSKELPPFSQAAMAELVSYMTIAERQGLGLAYQAAEARDAKKNEAPKTSATGS